MSSLSAQRCCKHALWHIHTSSRCTGPMQSAVSAQQHCQDHQDKFGQHEVILRLRKDTGEEQREGGMGWWKGGWSQDLPIRPDPNSPPQATQRRALWLVPAKKQAQIQAARAYPGKTTLLACPLLRIRVAPWVALCDLFAENFEIDNVA